MLAVIDISTFVVGLEQDAERIGAVWGAGASLIDAVEADVDVGNRIAFFVNNLALERVVGRRGAIHQHPLERIVFVVDFAATADAQQGQQQGEKAEAAGFADFHGINSGWVGMNSSCAGFSGSPFVTRSGNTISPQPAARSSVSRRRIQAIFVFIRRIDAEKRRNVASVSADFCSCRLPGRRRPASRAGQGRSRW